VALCWSCTSKRLFLKDEILHWYSERGLSKLSTVYAVFNVFVRRCRVDGGLDLGPMRCRFSPPPFNSLSLRLQLLTSASPSPPTCDVCTRYQRAPVATPVEPQQQPRPQPLPHPHHSKRAPSCIASQCSVARPYVIDMHRDPVVVGSFASTAYTEVPLSGDARNGAHSQPDERALLDGA
jgi:hypothetical protein